MTLALRYAVRSDVGLLREGNEDSAYAGPHLLAVADGMGGYEAGEVASAAVISSVAPLDRNEMPETDLVEALSGAVASAKQALRSIVSADPAVGSMGTTLTAMLWSGPTAAICHIGDSRAYLLRAGDFYQITRDHTFVQALIDQGRIRPEDAATHPQRSLLLRALDGRTDADPDMSVLSGEVGDRYLLCSDGLPVAVSDEQILDVLSQIAEPSDAVFRLIELALAGGGPDNITCIVADAIDTEDSHVTATKAPVVAGAAASGALPEHTDHTKPIPIPAADADTGATRMETVPVGAGLATTVDGVAATRSRGRSRPGRPGRATSDVAQGGATSALAGGATATRATGTRATAVRATATDSTTTESSPPAPRGHRRSSGRGWPVMRLIVALFALLVIGGLIAAYFWVRNSQYYVGTSKGTVVIYKGANSSVLGIPLSGVAERTGILVSGLPASYAQTLDQTSYGNLAAARKAVATLRTQYQSCEGEFASFEAWKAHSTKRVPTVLKNGHPGFKTVPKPKPNISPTCSTASGAPKS